MRPRLPMGEEQQAGPTRAAPVARPRVLVIEDDAGIRSLIASLLADLEVDVDVAGSGEEGLELAAQAAPDLAILDLGLPNMYGRVAGVELRRQFPNLPVLVVSAMTSATVAEDSWAIGAFAYLTKPFEMDAFIDTVKRGLEMARQL